MSIELQEARKKLDIFEKGVNNPEIFMSAIAKKQWDVNYLCNIDTITPNIELIDT